MSQENVDAVRRSLEAWNRGDVDGWLEPSHADVEWYSEVARRLQGSDTVYRGRAQLRQFWDEWHAVWDLTIEISEYRDLGEIVVALGRMRVHGKTSEIDIEQPVAYVIEFDGNLIRKMRAYHDQNQALEATGLSE